MRRTLLPLIENWVAAALRVASQLGIPKTRHLDSWRSQKHRALGVVTLLVRKSVTAAVQLDRQIRLFAREIQIVIAFGMLTTKLVAAEPPVTQPAPHEFFRPRFLLPQRAGAGAGQMVFLSALIPAFSPGDGTASVRLANLAVSGVIAATLSFATKAARQLRASASPRRGERFTFSWGRRPG
jgi:hypothetical protein